MGWTRSLCLSALPSTWQGNQNGCRCSSFALPISGWRFCGALSDRCFSCGSLFLCVSLPGPEAVLAWSRFSNSLMGADWTVFSARAGDSALPGLLHLHCRWDLHLHGRWYLHLHCVLESAPALPAHLHIHCILECSNKDSVFTRNWISSFLYRDRTIWPRWIQRVRQN